MVERSFTNQVVVELILAAVTYTSDIAPVLSKELVNIQETAVYIYSNTKFTLMQTFQDFRIAFILACYKLFRIGVKVI